MFISHLDFSFVCELPIQMSYSFSQYMTFKSSLCTADEHFIGFVFADMISAPWCAFSFPTGAS